MKRREEKAAVREIWQKTFADIDPDDGMARAGRVRDLCPCEFKWSVPLWDIIFAACEDPSPLVRVEALHVIQDAHERGFSTAGGMRYYTPPGAMRRPKCVVLLTTCWASALKSSSGETASATGVWRNWQAARKSWTGESCPNLKCSSCRCGRYPAGAAICCARWSVEPSWMKYPLATKLGLIL